MTTIIKGIGIVFLFFLPFFGYAHIEISAVKTLCVLIAMLLSIAIASLVAMQQNRIEWLEDLLDQAAKDLDLMDNMYSSMDKQLKDKTKDE